MDYCNTITMSGYTSRYLSPDIWNLVTSVGSLETETLCAAIGVGSVQTEGSWATTSTGTSLNIVLRGKSKSYIEIRFLIHEYNINEKICQSRCLWLQRLFKENRSTKIQLHRQTHTHPSSTLHWHCPLLSHWQTPDELLQLLGSVPSALHRQSWQFGWL